MEKSTHYKKPYHILKIQLKGIRKNLKYLGFKSPSFHWFGSLWADFVPRYNEFAYSFLI